MSPVQELVPFRSPVSAVTGLYRSLLRLSCRKEVHQFIVHIFAVPELHSCKWLQFWSVIR